MGVGGGRRRNNSVSARLEKLAALCIDAELVSALDALEENGLTCGHGARDVKWGNDGESLGNTVFSRLRIIIIITLPPSSALLSCNV